jgi:hypothetical protein
MKGAINAIVAILILGAIANGVIDANKLASHLAAIAINVLGGEVREPEYQAPVYVPQPQPQLPQ